MIKYLSYLVVYSILVVSPVCAQTIENLQTSFDGEKLKITYDLNCPDPKQEFLVSVYSSHDNYTSPLTFLTGDYGQKVLPGKSRQVIWDVRNALPANFDQEINIRIRIKKAASAVIPEEKKPAEIKTEDVKSAEPLVAKLSVKALSRAAYKKGSDVDVTWTGGMTDEKIDIELLRKGKVVRKVAEQTNSTQRFSWAMPRKIRAGKGYSLRISRASKPGEHAASPTFAIRPRIPLVMKAIPLLGLIFLFPPEEKPNDLPGPINP